MWRFCHFNFNWFRDRKGLDMKTKGTVGSRIKNLRKKAGLTQEELAFELNLESKSTISGYENDKREASHDILVELASKLNTTVDYILSGDSTDDSDIEILISAFKGIKSQKLREAAIKQIQILAAFEES